MPRGRIPLSPLLLGAALSSFVPAQAADEPRCAPKLRQQLDALVQDPDHPMAMLSVGLLRHGKLVFTHATGFQNYLGGTVPGTAASPQSLVRIASVSKLVTTLGLMRMVDTRQLALDSDVSDYLGFRLRNPAYPDTAITLRMLLSHTSTLSDEGGYNWPAETALADVLGPGADPARHWNREGKPGKQFAYSNLAWGVMGTVMERVSGERFDRLMQRLILDPLHMRGGYNPAIFPADRLAQLATLYSYEPPPEGGVARWLAQRDDYATSPPSEPAEMQHYRIGSNATPFSPTGGLRASVEDLAHVMEMLLAKGRWQGQQLLRPATVAQREQTQWRYVPALANGDNFHGEFLAWGLGTQRYSDQSAPGWGDRLLARGGWKGWGHVGFASGALSGFFYRQDKGDGMIYLISGTRPDLESYHSAYASHHGYQAKVLDAMAQCR